jgi:hypothetical protein
MARLQFRLASGRRVVQYRLASIRWAHGREAWPAQRCDRDDLADSLRRTAQSRLYPSESSPFWLPVVGLERCELSRQRSGALGVF